MMNAGDDEAARVVARYFDMWNTGDTSAATQILSPDWTDHAHPEVTGPAGVAEAVTSIRAARPDLRFHLDAYLTGGGDTVAAVGRVAASRLIWLVRLHDGRMAEMWTYHHP
ncbi:MAG: nuclear transport factor 2 family protein [Mycobacteriales bacterium]